MENNLNMRVIELETKIAFQEKTIEELNEMIIHQQFMLDKMYLQLRYLADKFKGMQNANIATLAEETLPPHY